MKRCVIVVRQRLFWALGVAGMLLGVLVPSSRAAALNWTILHEPSPGANQVQLQWVVRSGSLDDGSSTPGLAHFTARALLRGTTTRPYSDFSQALQAISATIQVETTPEFTRFICAVPAHRLDSFLYLLRDLFSNPEFDPFEIESLRKELLNELQKRRLAESSLLRGQALAQLYAGTSAQYLSEGTVEGLNRITGLDLRRFFRAHYGVSNYVLSLVTPFQDADLRFKLASSLRGVPDVALRAQRLPEPSVQEISAVVISELSASEIPFLMVFPGVAVGDPDYSGLELANQIFGMGPNSRLTQFSQSLGGGLTEAKSDFGAIIPTATGAKALSIQGRFQNGHEADAVAGVFALFRQFLREGVSEQELVASRERYLNDLAVQFNSPEKRGNYRLNALLSGSPLADLTSWETELQKWDDFSVSSRLKSRISASSAVLVLRGNPAQLIPALQSIPGMGSIRVVNQ
ncbi:MAG: insulinase family protein [Bdellovibrionales bacterium]|nr:insulinase family protein [Bdellovibrionales bacterium]